MKPYYENINLDFLQIFSMLIYLAAFFFLLMFISKKLLLKDDKFNRYYFVGLLSMYFILLIGDIKFDYIPLFPDTQLYYDFLNNSNSFISSEELSRGFGLFARSLYLLSFNNIGIYLLFNAVINQMGALIVWKAFRIYKQDKVTIKNQRLFLIISALYPVSIIFSLTLLRESYFLLAFAIFLIGIMKREKINIYIMLGGILVLLIRTKYIMSFIFIYSLKILFYNENFIKIKIIIITALTPFLYKAMDILSFRFLGVGLRPNYLRNFRNVQRKNYLDTGLIYPEVTWVTILDVLKDYPGLIAQFMLSPLPIIIRYDFLKSLAYTIDAFYVIIVLVLFLINLKNNYKNVFWIFTILILITLSSMFEYFITGAVRHRYVMVIMFIPLLFSDKKEIGFNGYRSFNVFHGKSKYSTIDFTEKEYRNQNSNNKSN